MSTPLVIIDMQYEFSAASKALKGVLKQIRLAKRRKAQIVVVEYTNSDPTYREIHLSLKNYKNVKWIEKFTDDGFGALRKKVWPKKWPSKLRICGVNRCACVGDTARSIHHKTDSLVEYANDAISCSHDGMGGKCYSLRITGKKQRFL
jgi:hypothetical protein